MFIDFVSNFIISFATVSSAVGRESWGNKVDSSPCATVKVGYCISVVSFLIVPVKTKGKA